jgi:hypothetical protein
VREKLPVKKYVTTRIPAKLTSILTIFCCLILSSCSEMNAKVSSNSVATEQVFDIQSNYGKSVYLHDSFATLATERAYLGILQRQGDPGGVRDWSEFVRKGNSSSWPKLLDIFLESEEFKTQIQAKQNGRQILDGLYSGFLGRGVDPDGARGYLQMIRQGKLREVVHIIAMSDEFFNKVLELPHPNQEQVQPAIAKVFAGLLNRSPSENERSKHNDPVTHMGVRGLHDLVEENVSSTEFKDRRVSSSQLITQVYAGFLQRLPSQQESARFQSLERKSNLKDAVLNVILSREFFDKL